MNITPLPVFNLSNATYNGSYTLFTLNKSVAGNVYQSVVSVESQASIPIYCVDKMLNWGCEKQVAQANRFIIVSLAINLILFIILNIKINKKKEMSMLDNIEMIVLIMNIIITSYLVFF